MVEIDVSCNMRRESIERVLDELVIGDGAGTGSEPRKPGGALLVLRE